MSAVPLNETFEQTVQDMRARPHQLSIIGVGIDTLPIENRSFEHIAEFLFSTEIIRTDEVDHAPVF